MSLPNTVKKHEIVKLIHGTFNADFNNKIIRQKNKITTFQQYSDGPISKHCFGALRIESVTRISYRTAKLLKSRDFGTPSH